MFTDTDTTTHAKHRVRRSSLLNDLRERDAAILNARLLAAVWDKPWDHKGRHTDTTRVADSQVTR